jgi:dTDP-4-dehydrorhamnose 3,5-epimerase
MDQIAGVSVNPLKVFRDERGQVMHMLRSDAPHFTKFGEIYFSVVNPGVVKGWRMHTKMTQNYAVPVGEIELVLYDSRKESASFGKVQKLIVGESNYSLITIPFGIVYAFKGISKMPAVVANCADILHDPRESVAIELNHPEIPYTWA